MLVRMWRKGNPLALLVQMQTGAATLRNSMEVPQKVKSRTVLWPSNCTPRHLLKGYKSTDLKGPVHSDGYGSAISNSQTMERAQMSINWGMDKEGVVYVYNGILLSQQKEENLALCRDVDGDRGYHAKWRRLIRERQIPRLHSSVEFKKENRWT